MTTRVFDFTKSPEDITGNPMTVGEDGRLATFANLTQLYFILPTMQKSIEEKLLCEMLRIRLITSPESIALSDDEVSMFYDLVVKHDELNKNEFLQQQFLGFIREIR